MANITLTNLAGYTFGVPLDEVSINIQKLTIKVTSEKIKVKDRIGHVTGLVVHDIEQEYSISGFVDGVTGAMAAAVGAIITVANIVALGGLATGGACIFEDPQLEFGTGELAKLDYKATRFPDIPLTATQTTV